MEVPDFGATERETHGKHSTVWRGKPGLNSLVSSLAFPLEKGRRLVQQFSTGVTLPTPNNPAVTGYIKRRGLWMKGSIVALCVVFAFGGDSLFAIIPEPGADQK